MPTEGYLSQYDEDTSADKRMWIVDEQGRERMYTLDEVAALLPASGGVEAMQFTTEGGSSTCVFEFPGVVDGQSLVTGSITTQDPDLISQISILEVFVSGDDEVTVELSSDPEDETIITIFAKI